MENKVIVPETRGARSKYDFDMDVGEDRKYKDVTLNSLLTCAKFYCNTRGLEWRFRCYTMNGFTHIIRVQ